MDRRASSPQLARSLRSETRVISAERRAQPAIAPAYGTRGSNPLLIENQFWVEIRPLVVATIQRLPQRTIESIRPIPGTVSPCAARQAPLGPSSTTVPPTTSRIVQPSIVVGRVSAIAPGLPTTSRPPQGPGRVLPPSGRRRRCRSDAVRGQWVFVGGGAGEWRAARALMPAVEAARAGTGGLGGCARHGLPIRLGAASDLLIGVARTTRSTRLLDGRGGRRGGEETRRARANDPSHAQAHRHPAGDRHRMH